MKKRILIITMVFQPEQFRLNDIACELAKEHEVTVLTAVPSYPGGRFLPGYGNCKRRKETWNGVRIIRLPVVHRGQKNLTLLLHYVSYAVSGFFFAHFTARKFDLVFINQQTPLTQALPGVWLAKRQKIPAVMYVLDLWPETLQAASSINNPVIIRWVEKLAKKIYSRCHLLLSSSQELTGMLTKRTATPVQTLYQHGEECYFPAEGKSSLYRENAFNIIYAGNIGFAQELDVLVELAKTADFPLHVVLLGDGRARQGLEQKVEKENLTNSFTFAAPVPKEEVPAALSGFDAAFISLPNPLLAQVLPAKLQSYLQCGVPVLACSPKGSEMENILAQAQAGYAAPDVPGLLQAIQALQETTPSQKAEMGRRAAKYAKDHFGREEIMRQLQNYLNNAMHFNAPKQTK